MKTEAQKRATKKYDDAHYRKVMVRFTIEEYEALTSHLNKSGESMAGFIRRVVKENTQK